MCIGTGETKSGNTCNTLLPTITFPWGQFGWNLDWNVIPVYVRIWIDVVQVARDGFLLQRKENLQNSGNTSGTFKVTDGGFYRTHHEWIFLGVSLTVNRGNGVGLNRVT